MCTHNNARTQTHTRTHNCARIDNGCMCLLKQLAWASLSHPIFLQLAATTGRMVEMVTFVASWYDCTSKQSGYVQLSVREVSEKFADRMFAFGTPAFRNYDLIFIVWFCLVALLFLMICVVQRCYRKWSVCKRQIMCNLYPPFLVYRPFYARKNLVCIRNTIFSSSALACRRAGSERIQNVSYCANIC